MNLNELKSSWERLYGEGLNVHDQDDIKKIIINGTSDEVLKINRKLFTEMTITAIAAIVSTVAIVFFYYFYDPTKYPWIDTAQLIPIQLTAVALFAMLFLSSFAEYRLVNKKFTSNTIKDFISETVTGAKKITGFLIQ